MSTTPETELPRLRQQLLETTATAVSGGRYPFVVEALTWDAGIPHRAVIRSRSGERAGGRHGAVAAPPSGSERRRFEGPQ